EKIKGSAGSGCFPAIVARINGGLGVDGGKSGGERRKKKEKKWRRRVEEEEALLALEMRVRHGVLGVFRPTMAGSSGGGGDFWSEKMERERKGCAALGMREGRNEEVK
ncbi:hypothetical protein HAX54_013968, partial [Datura stramonium]|nr:hypothetical protein [Datura stramonium]